MGLITAPPSEFRTAKLPTFRSSRAALTLCNGADYRTALRVSHRETPDAKPIKGGTLSAHKGTLAVPPSLVDAVRCLARRGIRPASRVCAFL